MRRVIALELVGLQKLDCDLYNETGKIIYEKGTDFTPELLMMLSHAKIYKRDEEPISIERELQKDIQEDNLIPTPEPLQHTDKAEYSCIITPKTSKNLLKAAQNILYSIEKGYSPTEKVCLEATEIILQEIYDKCDKASNINQLRVHDYYTYSHSVNTAVLSAIIGREIGFGEKKLKDLTYAGLLHDIGKIKISKEILYKPSQLTVEEFDLIKNHTLIGYDFLKKNSDIPEHIIKGALEHHERWNGGGYPNKLSGTQISEFAQIIAIADVFDALVSEKIYRGAVPSNDAIRIMLTEESKSFNPEIFHKFAYICVVKTIKMC